MIIDQTNSGDRFSNGGLQAIEDFPFFTNTIIIIIIIKTGRECRAGRERFTSYQSKDPSPIIPTNEHIDEE